MILRYPEVITKLGCKNISTMPIKICPGVFKTIEIHSVQQGQAQNESFVSSANDDCRRNSLSLPVWCNLMSSQLLIMDDVKLSHVTTDKITHFGLCSPELLKVFDTL